jgi:transposase
MRFVPVKSKERQAACMLMTLRERLVSVKSQLSNAFRSYAAEFGIVGPAGRQNVAALIKRVLEDDSLPGMARDLFRLQAEEYAAVQARLAKQDECQEEFTHCVASYRFQRTRFSSNGPLPV